MPKRITKLAKAPLAEVVFEFRWSLDSDADAPIVFRTDPGYTVLAEAFSQWAKREGLTHKKLMSPGNPPLGHSVDRRYYPDEKSSFPIWQIGPGIFAANESSNYEWRVFRGFVIRGLRALLSAYPRMKTFVIRPRHYELRYVDFFEGELVQDHDLIDFVNKTMNIRLERPRFFENKQSFSGLAGGRVQYAVSLKGRKDTTFAVDLASGEKDGRRLLRLESKVMTTCRSQGSRRTALRVSEMAHWLDDAHALTSPFFKWLMKPEIMRTFE
jgi:uncharacterized protein (TIGR04255 family)